MTRFPYLLIGCLLSLLSSSVFSSINIGLVASFDGGQQARSFDYQYGIQSLFNRINLDGGIKGKELALEVLNDHANGELAASNSQRLIIRKNVVALLGGDQLQTAEAIQRVATREKVLYLNSLTARASLYGKVGYVLNLRPSMLSELDVLCGALADKQRERLVIVYASDHGYSELVAESCLSKHSAVSVKTLQFSASRSSIERVKGTLASLEKQNVIFIGTRGDLSPLLSQVDVLPDSNGYYFLSSADVGSFALKEGGETNVNSIHYLPANYLSSEAYSNYMSDLKQLSPSLVPSKIGFEGYLAALVLTKGLEAVVSPFEIEDPNDLFRLPLSVARKLTGWVQTGGQNSLPQELSNALNVMHTLDLGLGLYLGFDGEQNFLKFPLHMTEFQRN
ncbi:ABC transporter substrate-binding protein [Marinomonas mediterranea]|uniref:ABC transporter substrate-binding protein n=1 Tax=Marinomonas mediterranea TaxID=119864 RepID=UPI00234BB7E5|nr:ABC transporter substrate-binding protein [Marinomonas mediterranea]WCN10411.1 ABC transporter substrate-binding protein [Marinomonas mediterranea]